MGNGGGREDIQNIFDIPYLSKIYEKIKNNKYFHISIVPVLPVYDQNNVFHIYCKEKKNLCLYGFEYKIRRNITWKGLLPFLVWRLYRVKKIRIISHDIVLDTLELNDETIFVLKTLYKNLKLYTLRQEQELYLHMRKQEINYKRDIDAYLQSIHEAYQHIQTL